MSRALPSPPLSSLTLSQIQTLANDSEGITDRSPRDWFERARHEADLAVLAERKGKKEEMFLAYTRACAAYANAKMHPDFAGAKRADAHWANRVKDFKETYDIYLHKAKDIKESLKTRDIERADGGLSNTVPNAVASSSRPPPLRQASNGPEVSSMGSIADRMKALRAGSRGQMGPMSVTGGAGNFGPARIPPTTTRDRAGSGSSMEHGRPLPEQPTSRRRSIPSNPPAHSLPAIGQNGLPAPSAPSAIPGDQSPAAEEPPVRPTPTGSSTRSHLSNSAFTSASDSTEQPAHGMHPAGDRAPTRMLTQRPPGLISPSHSGPDPARQPPSAGPSSKPSLPAIPHSPPSHDLSSLQSSGSGTEVPPRSPAHPPPNGLDDFEKAFPSLSEFGKQFEADEAALKTKSDGDGDRGISGLPNGSSDVKPPPTIREEGPSPEPSFPDVPSFPALPSVPMSIPSKKPSLPPPPARPTDIEGEHHAHSPPDAGLKIDIKRPASTPNVTTLPGDALDLDEPAPMETRAEHRDLPPPPPSLRPAGPPSTMRGTSPNGTFHDVRSPPTSFPAIKTSLPQPPTSAASVPPPTSTAPTAGPSKMELPPKPKFPFSNAVEPEVLRSYILNPSVNLLLLDARSEEDFQKGYVGKEYEPKGYPVQVVWMDPTVLMRNDMTSSKLEDALSLSPEAQRRAFEKRHKADLVVVYDSHSVAWPRKGSQPTPLSRLWDIIYEHEFAKRLERTPVMLTGGYDAWLKFMTYRQTRHGPGAAANAANGNGPVAPPTATGRTFEPKQQTNGLPSSPRRAERNAMSPSASGADLAKRANRDMPVYQSAQYARNIADSFGYGPQSMMGDSSSSYTGHPSRAYASPSGHGRPTHGSSHSISSYSAQPIPPPPQASIHPGPGARRKSDYIEHNNQAYSGYASSPPPMSPRQQIDYPQAHALAAVPQPPPAAQTQVFERYDTRPAVARSGSIRALDLVAREGDEVRYWNDVVLGLTGLKNLGNTCYMNSTLQCLSATFPFTSYFLDGSYKKSINLYNPLGTKGNLANAFAELLKALWKEDYTFLSPVTFRKNILGFAPQFSGTDQHDSQEFLSFVLDGLHEDLNRIKHKPAPVEMTPEREAALETLPPEVASEKEWQIYRMRNDSFIVDLFQGQYRNRLECLTCHKTSTTYDPFMYVSLPLPLGKKAVVVQELIDEFVKAEVMEKEDAWNCPRCKVPRRASKTLTIARLPPVLLIQLKRFTTQNGVFWDKSETPVIFPVNGLDMSRYVPRRQPTGKEDLDDPRTQVAPFKYDLYGVSNHMGTLSSGHYTAYVKSSKGWMFCEDSKIAKAQEKDVVSAALD
ncbi:ubiquitin-specific protease doa4 [Saitozyma podzolica]|uniref:ubiquitinyl hydrolase 1 n=1 Tax=Saitozyma podzolica TaxID=1890683 RepID=A0A427Y1Y6_9TREE|nr:ubiquitin-specific protease doa4 [Saitozyma podzolica]